MLTEMLQKTVAMSTDTLLFFQYFREIVARDLKSALNSIKLSDRGVYVQASTLGSLEALLEFLRTSKIPVSTMPHYLLIETRRIIECVAFPVSKRNALCGSHTFRRVVSRQHA